MIILRHGKFICDRKIFSPGDVLPDTATVHELVERGLAEIVADVPKKAVKTVKKTEPDTAAPVQENAKSNT